MCLLVKASSLRCFVIVVPVDSVSQLMHGNGIERRVCWLTYRHWSWSEAWSATTIFGLTFFYISLVVWMRLTNIESFIYILCSQLANCLKGLWGVWLCWRRYVSGEGLWCLKGPWQAQSHSLCLLLVGEDVTFSATAPVPCVSASHQDDSED